MELSGHWCAAPADEALRRSFYLPDFDDAHWEAIEVPGHWSDVAAFVDQDALLYRHRFETDTRAGADERAWLEFDGLFYQGDVYLDGDYLGDTEGYFVRHAFDVTDQLRRRQDHELAMEVTCRPSRQGKRRSIMGVFDGGNDVLHGANPGGIWAPVRIRRTGPVRIDSVRAICTDARAEQAHVAIRATVTAAAALSVRLITELGPVRHDVEHRVAEGHNEIEWLVTVARPELWWPRQLGAQPLYDLDVRVESGPGEVSDRHSQRLGLRAVKLRRWRLSVNEQQLHVKGINMGPTAALPAHASAEQIGEDLNRVVDAGLDLVRPYAHVAHPAFYDAADRLGLLVWQDLPLVGAAANGIRSEAVRQAKAMVVQLGHHPSIVLWNGHVSPAPAWMQSEAPSLRRGAERVVAHQMPTWSKSVLDRSIKRVFENNDGSRPATAFTGVLPHLPRLDGSATHLWFGWRRGQERTLADFAARLPSQVRWVAEFGAQSVPDHADVTRQIAWPRPEFGVLETWLGAETRSFQRYVPPIGHPSRASWVEATQLYQAGLLRRQIETLRRLKYRPNGGFCVHFLADAEPAISAAILGHDREPKLAYQAMVEACRPVIVVADRLPASVRPGEPYALDVHVVSDRRQALPDAVIDVELAWEGGNHRWRFGGTIDADSVTRVGTLSWVVPADAPGLATLHLTLSGPAEATNRYDTTIRSRP